MSFEVVRQLRTDVAHRVTEETSARSREGSPLGAEDVRRLTMSLIADAVAGWVSKLAATGQDVPQEVRDGSLARAVRAAIFGAGPLQPLLEDPDLENLDLSGYDQVWATYASKGRVQLPPLVESDEELIELIRGLAAHTGATTRPWSSAYPQLDLGLPDGVRVSALLAASARPQVSIRRDRLGPQAFLDQAARHCLDAISLVGLGMLDRQTALFLAAAVRSRANLLVAGATGAGKTTLLRALANAVPARERLVTIEQSLELRLGRDAELHPDVVELETVLPSPEGSGGLDGADLVRRSKRMNPDRLVFGEVLHGPEARAMLEAMLQGEDGSMSTIHSRDAHGAIARLIIGLGSLREPVLPATAAALIGKAVDFIVHVQKAEDGRRLVTEILEVSGHQGENVSCSTIFGAPEEFGEPQEDSDVQLARRDARIPIKRAGRLARHGYTDELGERLNAELQAAPRRRGSRAPQPHSRATTKLASPARSRAQPVYRAEPSPSTTQVFGQGRQEQPAGGSDPAGIPLLHVPEPDPSSPVNPDLNPQLNSALNPAVAPTREDLCLPHDGRGPGEPLAHRQPPEVLSFPADRASDAERGERVPVQLPPPIEASGAPSAAQHEGSWNSDPVTGPIIDMGARRRHAHRLDEAMPTGATQVVEDAIDPLVRDASPGRTREAERQHGRRAEGRRKAGRRDDEYDVWSAGDELTEHALSPAQPRGSSTAGQDADEPEWKKIGLPGAVS
ncbi:ATPase, T2SS/T4P/T4SS family [Kineosporia sp. NBRC 101677]|uniref:CpaF family protein n=1 Tax=Kineosporia sp. NBRC 101677 TaxID=3032197 RepID=UPI002553CC15|nr:ATPase, T2SS/T4P/T4SS family [Kineosporia sp. NBRC 101677]